MLRDKKKGLDRNLGHEFEVDLRSIKGQIEVLKLTADATRYDVLSYLLGLALKEAERLHGEFDKFH